HEVVDTMSTIEVATPEPGKVCDDGHGVHVRDTHLEEVWQARGGREHAQAIAIERDAADHGRERVARVEHGAAAEGLDDVAVAVDSVGDRPLVDCEHTASPTWRERLWSGLEDP